MVKAMAVCATEAPSRSELMMLFRDNVVFKVVRTNDAANEMAWENPLPQLCSIPASLCNYGNYSFVEAVKASSKEGVVALGNIEPDQFSRFFERLQRGKGHGNGLNDIEQFIDAYMFAIDLQDKNFQNVLIRELYLSLYVGERLVPKSLTVDKQLVKLVTDLSLVFECADAIKWNSTPNELLWVNLFVSAVAIAITSSTPPTTIDVQAYSRLIHTVDEKEWKGRFCELLANYIAALYTHNMNKLSINFEPVEKFLVKET
jgi:hypothetical protein